MKILAIWKFKIANWNIIILNVVLFIYKVAITKYVLGKVCADIIIIIDDLLVVIVIVI